MKWLKRCFIILILAVCVLYTYHFITQESMFSNHFHEKSSTESTSNHAYRTASPNELQDATTVWEKIMLSYLPGIDNMEMTDTKKSREIDGLFYKVIDAKIQKKWNDEWDYDPVQGEYKMNGKRCLVEGESFIEVELEVENKGNVKETWLNLLSLHIYSKSGEKQISAEPCTTSMHRRLTKRYYCCAVEQNQQMKVKIIYVVPDKDLLRDGMYFVDMTPTNQYPTSKEQVGLFKLPLGGQL